MSPEISIIIPVYNKLEYTKQCLASIWYQSQHYDYEIVIVANGCTDGTVEWLKERKKSHIKNFDSDLCLRAFKKPIGFARAINAGIQVALGKYLVFLNNDTKILGESWLDFLLCPFEADNRVGITGPLMSWSPDVQDFFLIFFCVCIPKWLPGQIGLLDTKFKEGYGEDIDYCMRAKKAGYKIVQVPGDTLREEKNTNVGVFPIYHKAEGTVHDPELVPDWPGVMERNRELLRKRYSR